MVTSTTTVSRSNEPVVISASKNITIGSHTYYQGGAISTTCEIDQYDHPVTTKELNNQQVMLYEAWGIPKENIKYETEFVNKTKQTYLNVTGHAELKDLGFENQINIHMLINTNIYEGYEVDVNDGMVMIVLHEIKNKAPALKDFGKEKFIKSCE